MEDIQDKEPEIMDHDDDEFPPYDDEVDPARITWWDRYHDDDGMKFNPGITFPAASKKDFLPLVRDFVFPPGRRPNQRGRKSRDACMRSFLGNLLIAYRIDRPLAYSRRWATDQYAKRSRSRFNGKVMREAADYLVSKGVIDHFIGYRERPYRRGSLSRAWLTEEFIQHCRPVILHWDQLVQLVTLNPQDKTFPTHGGEHTSEPASPLLPPVSSPEIYFWGDNNEHRNRQGRTPQVTISSIPSGNSPVESYSWGDFNEEGGEPQTRTPQVNISSIPSGNSPVESYSWGDFNEERVPSNMRYSAPNGEAELNEPADKIDDSRFQEALPYLVVPRKLHSVIRLKNSRKELIEYEDTEDTEHMEEFLNRYNAAVLSAEIIGPDWDAATPHGARYSRMDCRLYRVFNRGSFDFGGRFYGGRHISLKNRPGEQRRWIVIDRQATWELDYVAFQLRLLYHLRGIHVNPTADLYLSSSSSPEEKQKRGIVKSIAFRLINSKPSARKQIAYRIRTDAGVNTNDPIVYDRADIQELVDEFERRHVKIKEDFFSDQGIRLMRLESRITEDVLRDLLAKQIICLPIHDSYIVQRQHSDELHRAMVEYYKRHVNDFEPVIREPEKQNDPFASISPGKTAPVEPKEGPDLGK